MTLCTAGNDTYYGGVGDDNIYQNAGIDIFDGSDGIDTLYLTYSTVNVAINLALGSATFPSGVVEQITNFENLVAGAGE